MLENKDRLDFLPFPNYREPSVCHDHNSITDEGWCWECACETYGYDKAVDIYNLLNPTKAIKRQ